LFSFFAAKILLFFEKTAIKIQKIPFFLNFIWWYQQNIVLLHPISKQEQCKQSAYIASGAARRIVVGSSCVSEIRIEKTFFISDLPTACSVGRTLVV